MLFVNPHAYLHTVWQKFLGLARKHISWTLNLLLAQAIHSHWQTGCTGLLHVQFFGINFLFRKQYSESFFLLALLVIEQNWIFSKNGYVLISIRPCEHGKIINTVILVGAIIWFSVGLHTVVMCIDLYPSILLLVSWTIFQSATTSKNWNCWKMYCLVCSYPVKLRLCMIVKYRDLRIHCIILFDIGVY